MEWITRFYTQIFGIVSVSFDKDDEWVLVDGRGSINIVIKDEEFLQGIENKEIELRKGDRLVCEVELIEDLNNIGIILSYSIVKVKEHKRSLKRSPKD
ncbi:hypothetical protein BKH46_08400 [Helicobacter sp. 12S02634-8]|uniref:hypothetical protein n=1 Tax=Helicobacter sp. 12S02634-8 TaxID=1476199 RepID=UPI000BA77B1C|nr:hypothetical protein [Helicobacter sp. 12S02634-8]PAF46250.1 hypothetical protein BKH46_08400 [Helicobacter sp. 12S02634-8]